jgi:deoxyribonuclease-4
LGSFCSIATSGRGSRSVKRSNDVLGRGRHLRVVPLLEVSAGQGSSVGYRFEHLARILERVTHPEPLGVCLDTCHLHAAGYNIATPRGYEETLSVFERVVGFDRLKAVHLNDAGQPWGAVGTGMRRSVTVPLGLATFRRLVRDPHFQGVPMVLETPGPLAARGRELKLLRALSRHGV